MGCKSDMAAQMQKDGSDGMSMPAAEYEEGSEEEEPFEREFYVDDEDGDDDEQETQAADPCDDYPLPEEEEEEASGEEPCDGAAPPEDDNASDEEPFYSELCDEEEDSDEEPFVSDLCAEEEHSGEEDSFCAEPFTDPVCNANRPCIKQLHEVEPYNDPVAHEEEFVNKRFSAVQDVRKEQNKQEAPKLALRKGSSTEYKAVSVTDEMEVKPFKKRLSVRFATDVSCYTYSTESFGAAKLEKRKAQFDDQDNHLCKRQEHIVAMPQGGDKLKEVDDTNLYVGNLPAFVSSSRLVDLFACFGRIIRSKVVDDCFTGISQGYGFVKYADPQSAASAIKCMNGRLVGGKNIEVRVAGVLPSVPNPSMHSVSETCSLPSKEIDTSSLFIFNLPLSMDTLKLLEHFLPFGKIAGIKVPRDHTTGLSKGYGFVKYFDSHDAAQAVAHLNGVLVEGKKMAVQVSCSPSTLTKSVVGSHTNTGTIKEIDMANLYVCNIPPSIDTNKLVELFLPFGKITQAKVAADQGTFSGNGYGFVKFADPQCATEAIAVMNGALIEGENLTVRVAGLSSSASGSAVKGSLSEINKSRLYVTNLPQSMDADKLVNLFVPFGQISKVVMSVEYSLVYYADEASAIAAVKNMDGYLIDGKRLAVRRSGSCITNAAESGVKPLREIDMANLFVGSIPPAVTPDQLVELFRPFGQVVQARMFQHQGYGLVRYDNSSSAAAAIGRMDGYQIGGRTLVVRVAGLPNAKDYSAAKNTLSPEMCGKEKRQIDMTNLYVCRLPLYITTEKLVEIFLPCGQISQAKVVVDRYTGVSKGFGFVRFADTYGAAMALTHMSGYPLEGHFLEVRIAGVHPGSMSSYMTYLYSQLTLTDPSTTSVGVPTYWPYYYAESAYATSAENQVQGTTPATDASSQTSQQEGLPESVTVSSVSEKDCSSVSSHVTDSSQPQSSAGWAGPPGFHPHAVCSQPPSAGWAGPPGFEPHAAPKKDAGTVMNPSQPCSKVHLARSEAGQKRRSVV